MLRRLGAVSTVRLQMPQARVLLADDHRETAELLRGLLQSEFDVVGQVQDGLADWHGDIVIGRANEIPKTPADIGPAMARGARRAIYIDGDAARWRGGVVPYTIDGGLASAEVT